MSRSEYRRTRRWMRANGVFCLHWMSAESNAAWLLILRQRPNTLADRVRLFPQVGLRLTLCPLH